MAVIIVAAVRGTAKALTWRTSDYPHWIELPSSEAVQLGRAQDTYVGHMPNSSRSSVMIVGIDTRLAHINGHHDRKACLLEPSLRAGLAATQAPRNPCRP